MAWLAFIYVWTSLQLCSGNALPICYSCGLVLSTRTTIVNRIHCNSENICCQFESVEDYSLQELILCIEKAVGETNGRIITQSNITVSSLTPSCQHTDSTNTRQTPSSEILSSTVNDQSTSGTDGISTGRSTYYSNTVSLSKSLTTKRSPTSDLALTVAEQYNTNARKVSTNGSPYSTNAESPTTKLISKSDAALTTEGMRHTSTDNLISAERNTHFAKNGTSKKPSVTTDLVLTTVDEPYTINTGGIPTDSRTNSAIADPPTTILPPASDVGLGATAGQHTTNETVSTERAANYTQSGSAGCNGCELPLIDDYVTSPNYPSRYDNFLCCSKEIIAPIGKTIRLSFTDFSVEFDIFCSFDSLQIFDGSTITSPPLTTRLCGKSIPAPVISSGEVVLVFFQTDYSKKEKGFRALVEFL